MSSSRKTKTANSITPPSKPKRATPKLTILTNVSSSLAESRGLPESLIYGDYDNAIRIPMFGSLRSLNLSNAVAIVLYEALRHNDYFGQK